MIPAWTDNDLASSVWARFARVAAAIPDRVALRDTSGVSLTYRDLEAAALVVAGDVLASAEPGAKVVLLSDMSVGNIAGLLGIVAAGCAYVPVDATEAPQRATGKIESSGATVLVHTPGLERLAEEMAPQATRLAVDLSRSPDPATTLPSIEPTTHFNLIFTSGSTGQPKGVVQVHRNVLFDTDASNKLFPIELNDVFGLAIPLTFGASVSDVMGALLNGARLDTFDLKTHGVEVMADWMAERGITVTHLVPTVLRRWLSAVDSKGRYPKMRMIRAGGEPLFRTDLELFSQKFSTGMIRNGLGTTETYLIAAALLKPGDTVDENIVPVGEPASGRKVTIVGDDGLEVPAGEIGEIHVTSAYLSPGYWKDPDATRKSYIFDEASGARTYRTGDLGRVRDDGQIEHLGRVDDMVKVSGMAVHLTAVETIVMEVPGVRESVVTADRDQRGNIRLVAHLVVDEGFAGAAQMRAILSNRVPAHMVPARIDILDTLPTLPFGKVDRKALASRNVRREIRGEPYMAPTTDTESSLAAAAASALGVARVGIEDDLFDLGLDSLSAVQLIARVRETLGCSLAIDAIFETPTVASLAQIVQSGDSIGTSVNLEFLLDEVEQIGETGAKETLGTVQR